LRAEVDWIAEPGEGSGFSTAQETLEAIDESVGIFSGDAPLQDDLTLMVVKRLFPVKDGQALNGLPDVGGTRPAT